MHYLFLLNPAAGRQDTTAQTRRRLEVALLQCGIPRQDCSFVRTMYKGHAKTLARQAARTGQPVRIWAAGGDGTFREALEGASPYPNAAVGCIPAGSGNDFLRTFGTKAEFLDLADQLRGGVVPIDLMDTSLGLSAAVCAAGLDAQVAMGAADFRRNPLFHGEAAYLLSALRQICGPIGRRLRFVVDGESFAADVLMCAACNTRDYGGGFRAAPNACPWDGWIDLVIVRRVSRAKILRLLGRYKKGGHFSGAELDVRTSGFFIYRRARSISIETADGAGPLVATADGECAPVEKLDISLRPLAGRVILPRAAFERAKAPVLSRI